jgi:hypothetical protein
MPRSPHGTKKLRILVSIYFEFQFSLVELKPKDSTVIAHTAEAQLVFKKNAFSLTISVYPQAILISIFQS